MGKGWPVAALAAIALAGCSLPQLSQKEIKPEIPPAALLYTTFQVHAVLQRDRPIPVWGLAAPGAQVSVTLAGETASAAADASGKWRAELAPLKAGGPYELTAISSAGQSETVKDVLVGDVYLCSGQSNMEWPVHLSMHGEADAAGASNPNIRLFTVHRFASPTPRDSFGAEANWAVAGPASVKDFSAVCYFFGRELQPKAGVPIGLISSIWGGSPIQPWMSREALTGLGGYGPQLDILSDYVSAPDAAKVKWHEITATWWQAHDPNAAWRDPTYDDTAWDEIVPTGSWKDWGVPALKNFDGIVWFRKTVTLSAAQAQGVARLSLGPIDQADTTWVNGADVGGSEGWNAERDYTVAAGTLHEGKNVIAAGVLGGDGMWGPSNKRTLKLADGTIVKLDTAWRYRISAPARHTGAMPHTPWLKELGLTMLYNGMIAPLGPTPLSGILWYQGESNTNEAGRYAPVLRGLISDWRRQFGAETPFLIVQLPSYGPAATAPEESEWAELREAQRRVADETPHSGLAVTIDLGDRRNLHPVVKQEVGRRLALIAERWIYGQNVVDSGPAPISAHRSGHKIAMRFADLAKGFALYGSQRPVGFELCDKAKRCRFVDATLSNDEIDLNAKAIRDAASVRYCWADSPICNVYNSEGLPAVPFELPITAATRRRK